MNVLIAVASRHGSTREIAEVLARELRASGHVVDLREAGDFDDLYGYDAAVVGSAVYLGSWQSDAQKYVARNQARLRVMPVWLFSSGPLTRNDSQPTDDPRQLDALMRESGARGHRTFAGKLDPDHLGFGEKIIAGLVKAPAGDFRDWDTIRAWGREIAHALATFVPAAA